MQFPLKIHKCSLPSYAFEVLNIISQLQNTYYMREHATISKSQQKQQVVDSDPQRPQTLELSDMPFKIILTYLMIFLKGI